MLRGISMLGGVDSAYMGFPTRQKIWERIATDLKPQKLVEVTRTIGFEELPDAFEAFIKGHVKGRVVVQVVA